MPVAEAKRFFDKLELTEHELAVGKRLLTEIRGRLQFLLDVGLGYLTLDRLSSTLSGGESQRINLATSLGSSLVGSLYILDEPSIGLHSRDTDLLIRVLKQLRDLGNTVVVVMTRRSSGRPTTSSTSAPRRDGLVERSFSKATPINCQPKARAIRCAT